jgi:hypothetical protein
VITHASSRCIRVVTVKSLPTINLVESFLNSWSVSSGGMPVRMEVCACLYTAGLLTVRTVNELKLNKRRGCKTILTIKYYDITNTQVHKLLISSKDTVPSGLS